MIPVSKIYQRSLGFCVPLQRLQPVVDPTTITIDGPDSVMTDRMLLVLFFHHSLLLRNHADVLPTTPVADFATAFVRHGHVRHVDFFGSNRRAGRADGTASARWTDRLA